MSHRPEKRAYVTDAAHMQSLLEPNPLLPPMLIRFTEYLGGIIAGASHYPSTEWKESRVRQVGLCASRPFDGIRRVQAREKGGRKAASSFLGGVGRRGRGSP